MAHLQKSVATLRIFGDALVPAEISKLLGAQPTEAAAKGEIIRKASGREHASRHGFWRLEAPNCEPENLDHQISVIFSGLSSDSEVWAHLNKNYKVDLFCGLFMSSGNEGFSLSFATLKTLADRGIEIGFDIYEP